MESEFEDVVNLGNSLSSDKKVSKNISEELSTLKSAGSHIIDLHSKRNLLEILRKIMKLIKKITEKSESIFLATKNSIELSHHWKKLSFENVENILKNIQAVESEISSVDDAVSIMQNFVDELNSYKEDFNSTFKQNALQYSLSILYRWTLFKKSIIKQNSSLLKRALFEEFLKALRNLEDWLTSKEKIADSVNYAEPGHSRNTYLEGVGVFESHLLAACRSSVDVIQHLSQFLFYEVPDEGEKPGKTEIKLQSEDLLQQCQRIENLALNKECRVMENRKSCYKFTKELKGLETWVQKALQDYSSQSCTCADIKKLVLLLQKHKFRERVSLSSTVAASASNSDGESSDRSECLSFLPRVVGAAFDFQIIFLLMLLGAAILLPVEEEKQLSCCLSNNFASSLNLILWYPDGPPPV